MLPSKNQPQYSFSRNHSHIPFQKPIKVTQIMSIIHIIFLEGPIAYIMHCISEPIIFQNGLYEPILLIEQLRCHPAIYLKIRMHAHNHELALFICVLTVIQHYKIFIFQVKNEYNPFQNLFRNIK